MTKKNCKKGRKNTNASRPIFEESNRDKQIVAHNTKEASQKNIASQTFQLISSEGEKQLLKGFTLSRLIQIV